MRQVIHIPDEKDAVIKYLKGQLNMSGYIVDLIEKDMGKGNLDEYIANRVDKYLDEMAEKIKNSPIKY